VAFVCYCMLLACQTLIRVCYSCMAPSSSFEWNKEVLGVTREQMVFFSSLCCCWGFALWFWPFDLEDSDPIFSYNATRSSFFFTAAPSAFYSKILLISWQFPRPCCTQNGVNSYRAEMLCRLFTANCPAMRSDCSTLISLSSSKQGLLLRAPQPPPPKQPGEAEKWQVPSAWKAYAQRWVCCRWHVAGGRGWPQMPRPRSGTTQSRERYQFQKHSNFRHVKFQTVGWSKFMRLPVYAPSLFAQFPPIKWSAAAPLRSGYPTTSLPQTENT